ncbi:MAG: hypothetical protein Kow0020_12620 [Wenzhouxiangellaceae bacterium]
MKRWLLWTLAVGTLASVLAAFWIWRQIDELDQAVLLDAGEARVWIPRGMHFAGLGRELEALGMIEVDWRWRLLGRLRQPLLQAGEYQLQPGDRLAGLLDRIGSGAVVQHDFTIIEGWTVARLREALRADPRLLQITTGLAESELMARLGCPGCYAEGWFLPETYRFQRGASDFELLERAYRAMRAVLDEEWAGRDPDLPLESPEQLLILASLVEAETRLAEERARVAGVFVRRLQRGMRLQTDPTVAYGVAGGLQGRLRRSHLTTDHPWNTYTRHGLPPTPIALPGRAALHAAAHPARDDALYFVARGDGSHHFSATLEEHNGAVARYILDRK